MRRVPPQKWDPLEVCTLTMKGNSPAAAAVPPTIWVVISSSCGMGPANERAGIARAMRKFITGAIVADGRGSGRPVDCSRPASLVTREPKLCWLVCKERVFHCVYIHDILCSTKTKGLCTFLQELGRPLIAHASSYTSGRRNCSTHVVEAIVSGRSTALRFETWNEGQVHRLDVVLPSPGNDSARSVRL